MKVQYDEDQILGRGDYSIVFRGTFNRQPVAVKRIQLIDARNSEELANCLASLHHPNVVRLLHSESDAHFRYHALELCAGSLDQLFLSDQDPKKYRGPMPAYDLIVLHQLAAGLYHIHSNGLVHGDVRPENVLISTGTAGSRQRVLMKWADFGLCREMSDKWIRSIWMAPEMIDQSEKGRHRNGQRKTRIDTAESDMFSQGCVFFYFLMGGIHPFGAPWEVTSNVVRNRPVHFTKLLPGHFARGVTQKMLEPEPEDRLTSDEVVQQLSIIMKPQEVMNNDYDDEQYQQRGLELLELCSNPDPQVESMCSLIDEGVDLNCTGDEGMTPLLLLCRWNQTPRLYICLKLLLVEREHHYNPVDINCRDINGWNALLYLSRHYPSEDLLQIIHLLIDHGIQVDCKNEDGENALLFLCQYYSNDNLIDIIQLLIQQGIDVDCCDHNGWNALLYLCLHYSNDNLIAIIELLVHHGINVNCTNNYGNNALRYLCQYYSKDNLLSIIQLLIRNGIDINSRNNYGNDALRYLCQYYAKDDLVSIVQLLIENGIDLRLRNHEGWNALLTVCQFYTNDNLADIVQLLIQNGVDVNGKNKDGWNALMLLCRYYTNEHLIDVIQILIESGIDLNSRTPNGSNALLILCANYSKDNLIAIVKLLTRNGIDARCKDSDGGNAVRYVRRWYKGANVLEITQLLITNGCGGDS